MFTFSRFCPAGGVEQGCRPAVEYEKRVGSGRTMGHLSCAFILSIEEFFLFLIVKALMNSVQNELMLEL